MAQQEENISEDFIKTIEGFNLLTREVLFERIRQRPLQNRAIIEMFRPVPIEREPIRNNRFVVEFPNEFVLESYFVQKISKPKFINYEWQNIEIFFIDVIGPSTSKVLVDVANYCAKRKDINKILFDFSIKTLDPTGVEIEHWKICVEKLIEIDFGNFDYSDESLAMIKMIIKPKCCVYIK